jgi:hypothetical protein
VEIEERFWSKVDYDVHDTSRCWTWEAHKTRGGYGQFGIYSGQMVSSHRLAYELEVGVIPDGLDLDHLCRNRSCVNPNHLEPVSEKENALRGIGPTAVNARKTHCPRGHHYDGYEVEASGASRRFCTVCRKAALRERTARYRARKKGLTNA